MLTLVLELTEAPSLKVDRVEIHEPKEDIPTTENLLLKLASSLTLTRDPRRTYDLSDILLPMFTRLHIEKQSESRSFPVTEVREPKLDTPDTEVSPPKYPVPVTDKSLERIP